jgi:hypothetical protein
LGRKLVGCCCQSEATHSCRSLQTPQHTTPTTQQTVSADNCECSTYRENHKLTAAEAAAAASVRLGRKVVGCCCQSEVAHSCTSLLFQSSSSRQQTRIAWWMDTVCTKGGWQYVPGMQLQRVLGCGESAAVRLGRKLAGCCCQSDATHSCRPLQTPQHTTKNTVGAGNCVCSAHIGTFSLVAAADAAAAAAVRLGRRLVVCCCQSDATHSYRSLQTMQHTAQNTVSA